MEQLYFVFDCESIGLHGETFCVGWCVVNQNGKEISAGIAGCRAELAHGDIEGHRWVTENVPPLVRDSPDTRDVRTKFWNALQKWKGEGALIFSDCGVPVESNFLAMCVADDPARGWYGPYPLHDVATVLLCAGKDPLATPECFTGEYPKHNPLCDARQSARLLTEALSEIANMQASC